MGRIHQEVYVKNTFIDCDDRMPDLMDMRRSVTDTATVSVGGPLEYYSYPPPDETIPEVFEEEEEPDDDASPPTPMGLSRAVTTEQWESAYDWSWALEMGAGPTMPQEEQQMMPMRQGPTMAQHQDGYAMQPMMPMMPMMQKQPAPAMASPTGQQYMLVPMPMRGIRWPDEMQRMPQMDCPPPCGSNAEEKGIRWSDAETPPQGIVVKPSGMAGPTDAPRTNRREAPKWSDQEATPSLQPSSRMENPKYTSKSASDCEPPGPQTLTRAFSVGSGAFRINWTVSAFKLQSGDKNAVSPPFELSFGGPYSSTKFKLMLFPTVSTEGKGGSSFRKSKGKGFIQLKCEADLQDTAGTLKFRLFVGTQPPRGPVTHDFSHSAVKGLSKDIETWDLDKSVTNGHFVVGAEIIPTAGW